MTLNRRQMLMSIAGAPLAMSAPVSPSSKASLPGLSDVLCHQAVERLATINPVASESLALEPLGMIDKSLANFVSDCIGKPWTVRENCWVFTARIQRDFFGRSLPLVNLPRTPQDRAAELEANPERSRWHQVSRPVHGAVVLMSALESPRLDQHAGVCLMMPGPLIVHVDDPHGVVADDLMTCRLRGWFPTYWMPNDGPTPLCERQG